MKKLRSLLPYVWTLFVLIPVAYGVAYAVEGVYGVPLEAGSFRFERPWAALLLFAVPLIYAAHHAHRRTRPRLRFSRGPDLAKLAPGFRTWFVGASTGLRATALALVVLGLMGPQSIHARNSAEINGIDIVVVMDMSLSMEAADVEPSRFEATKEVVQDFLARRPNDRIGAVVFGRDAYTLMPLTTDKEALRSVIRELELELIDGRGTAIGNAVGTGLNRLRRSTAKSKVIILLTDGASNAGNIQPDEAAELARTMEVKVFPILMGQSEESRVQRGTDLFGRPMYQMNDSPINDELLVRMAERTGGEFFPVSDRSALERSFHTILDELERTEIEDSGKVYAELFPVFVWPAFALLFLELLVGVFVLRRWP